MNHNVLQIQLRQMDVGGANARHYFWVLAKMLPNNKFRVLQELHGFPADWKTGRRKSISLGGDQLKAFRYKKPEFYNQSRKLPYEIAKTGIDEEILPIWNMALGGGDLVNRRKFSYSPFKENSNALAALGGLMMDLKVQRIGDPRNNPVHATVPGLSTKLFPGFETLKQHSGILKPLGGVGFMDEDGNEPDSFSDPFREDIPF